MLTVHRHWQDPLTAPAERRSGMSFADFLEIMQGPASTAGVPVTAESALRQAAVYRCVALIAGSLGSLPQQVYARTSRGKRKATERPEYRLLHRRPNAEMNAGVWKETGQAHVLLRGNHYSRIEWTLSGRNRGLWPLDPDKVTPERVAGRLRYTVRLDGGGTESLAPDEVIHVPALSRNGVVGFSPLEVLRNPVGIALAAEATAATLFRDGIRGSGVLSLPGASKEAEFNRARAELEAVMSGKLHRALVVGGGAEWKPLTITPDDAQFLETRKFQVAEIARIFGVPPHMVGDVDKSTSWGTGIEQQSIGFVVYVIGPWLVRWEEELNAKLFPGDLGDEFFCKFNLASLLRGDLKAQSDALAVGVQHGWLSIDDCREFLDLDRVDGGKQHFRPGNLVPLAEPMTDPDGGNDDAEA